MKRIITLAAVLAVAAGACADVTGSPDASPVVTADTTDTTGPSTRPDRTANPLPEQVEPVDTSAIPAGLMVGMLTDASTRSGISASDIYAVRAEPTLWNDGSLGCPEPDMSYTQAQVDGYRVVFQAGDTLLDYRASESGFFVFCASPTAG